jgi:hypothetical protein
MSKRDFVIFQDDFTGANTYPFAAGVGPWAVKKTAAAGTPTAAIVTPGSSGEIALTLEATSEAQNLGLCFFDNLVFDITKLKRIIWVAKLSAVLSAVQTACFGLAGAQNNTNTSMVGALFNIVGDAAANALICRTKHSIGSGLTVNQASATVLSTTMLELEIDLNDKKNVKFYVAGQRLLPQPTAKFDLSGMTGGVQPIAQINKASGTGVPVLTADYVEVQGIR